jgi:pimeloyl-ACP methyl ester carboxylesterase
MHERDTRFRSGDNELAGTLTLPSPDGSFASVLLLPGSGQVDRDENCRRPRLHINALHDIAHHLAGHGIASLRFDKRGIGQSDGDYWTSGFHDRVDDARAALDHLRNLPTTQPGRLFLLGHSEGSLVSTSLLGSGVEVAGGILLSGAAQSGEAVLKWQALRVARGLTGINGLIVRTFHIDIAKAQQKHIDAIRASDRDLLRRQLVVKVNAKWLREFMDYDPAPDLQRITAPLLAITGSNDIQVDPEDLDRMAALVQGPFEQHVISDMTHLLRVDDASPSISRYKRETREPISSELLSIVTRWLEAQGGGNRTSPPTNPVAAAEGLAPEAD